MKIATHNSAEIRTGDTTGTTFPQLDRETRPTVDTAAAAHYLNRRPQTLRIWASKGSGPMRPVRINGRLAWPVQQLRLILAGLPSTPEAKGRPRTLAQVLAAQGIEPALVGKTTTNT